VSVTSLDQELTRVMEPRTSSPAARLRAIAELSAAGIPTMVKTAPIIPGLTDHELPALLAAAREAGAHCASFTILRLPSTVREVFLDWLRRHRPNHADKVEHFIRAMRGGKLNNSNFGERHRGEGPMADQIVQTFKVFAKRNGLDGPREPLNVEAFVPPKPTSGQLSLF
jgi:DNA repair photolyase